MNFKTILGMGCVGFVVAGCMETATMADTPQEVGPLTAQIADRTGVHESGATVTWHADGRMTGKMPNGDDFAGVWEERDGQFCRTNIKPERIAASGCMDMKVEGNKVISSDPETGKTTVFTLRG